jgi:tRNA threonylcarbamoyladenosine biosynthesis protein TsaE
VLDLLARSLADTDAVAGALAALVRPGDVIVLAGEMGAGKTAFARAFGRSLGVTDPVTSPTFTLLHTYDGGRLPMHHADLYRLSTMNEVADLGLPELAEGKGVVLVEWGDVASGVLGDHLELTLVALVADDAELDDPDSARHIVVRPVGGRWATRWSAVTESLAAWTTGKPAC